MIKDADLTLKERPATWEKLNSRKRGSLNGVLNKLKKFQTQLWFAGGLGTLNLILWADFFGLRKDVFARIALPFKLTGDNLFCLTLMKSLVAGSWFPFGQIHEARLGFPFGMNLSDFPMPDTIHHIFWWGIGLFIKNPYLLYNLYFLLTYSLTFISFFLVCRYFWIKAPVAAACAVLYSLLPFHFLRYNHLIYAGYFLVPLGILVMLELWGPEKKRLSRKAWVSSLFFGIDTIYYAFFFCYLVLISGIASALYRRSTQKLWKACALVAVTFGVMLVAIAPTLSQIAHHGRNHEVAVRQPSESEFVGYKLIYAFLPAPGHRSGVLARLHDHYQPGFPLPPEGFGESFGLFGAVGILILLLQLAPIRRGGAAASTLQKLAVIFIFAFLFGTVGGFSSMFANWVHPGIRSVNRISIFMATLAWLAFALVFNRWYRTSKSRPVAALALLVVFLVGVWDLSPHSMRISDDVIPSFRSDQAFFKEMEASLPEGSAVLQLPWMGFPEVGPPGRMADYDPFKAYLLTKHLRFSYGSMRGRPPSKVIEEVSTPPLDLRKIRGMGFKAIYVDRYGYDDSGKGMENWLSAKLHEEPHVSSDGRRSYFAL